MKRRTLAEVRTTLDASVPRGTMTLSGLVKTANGYCVGVVEITPDGKVLSQTYGRSQSHMEFVALEHRKLISALARKVQ